MVLILIIRENLTLFHQILTKTMKKKCWTVYILECSDFTFYTGITNNIKKRLISHNLGKASRYTRCRIPVKLIFTQQNLNHSDALKREYEIKSFTRKQKEEMVKKSS